MIAQLSSLLQICHMGGYAAYVWPAYASVIITLLSKFCWARYQVRAIKKRLQEKYAQTA